MIVLIILAVAVFWLLAVFAFGWVIEDMFPPRRPPED